MDGREGSCPLPAHGLCQSGLVGQETQNSSEQSPLAQKDQAKVELTVA